MRPGGRSDVAALAELVRGHPLFERYGLRPAALATSLEAAMARGEPVVTAWSADASGDHALGFAWWTPKGAFGRSPYLRLLVVDAAATGAGVGGRLLEAVETAAFAVAGDLFTLVSEENAGARRLYARHGYTEVGRLADYVAPDLHEVVLRKRRTAEDGQAPGSGA